jgi:hypothetical protein
MIATIVMIIVVLIQIAAMIITMNAATAPVRRSRFPKDRPDSRRCYAPHNAVRHAVRHRHRLQKDGFCR